MKAMRAKAAALVFASVLAAACSGRATTGEAGGAAPGVVVRPAAAPLVGTWDQEDVPAEQPRQTFVFRPDGSALWIFASAARADTMPVRYRLDAAAAPAALDLFGFATGRLQGRTLYCILDLAARDSFRMDCESAAAERPAAEVRPASFTSQTLAYRRRP